MFTTTRFFAIASLALAAQVASAAKCTRTYTIKAGDICDSISAANQVSTYQLAAINSGKINEACNNLQIGDTLCLGTEGEDCTKTHNVVAGDSCAGIWESNGVNSTIFLANNPQVNAECTNIYIGEVVCVANAVQVPPVPGVPIHTGPVASDPAPTRIPPTSTVAAPAVTTSAPATTIALTGSAEITKAPGATGVANAARPVASSSAAPAGEDGEDCPEDGDLEIVTGETDEDLPFCDEL